MVGAQYRIATGSPCIYIFPSFTTTCFQPVPHHSTLYRRTQDGIYGVRYNSLPLQKSSTMPIQNLCPSPTGSLVLVSQDMPPLVCIFSDLCLHRVRSYFRKRVFSGKRSHIYISRCTSGIRRLPYTTAFRPTYRELDR